jgi:hypothetical protein
MTKSEPSEPTAIDPELAPLEASFARGDFAALHEQLAQTSDATADKPRASALRAAVSVDNAHIAVIALCLLGLIAVALQYLK